MQDLLKQLGLDMTDSILDGRVGFALGSSSVRLAHDYNFFTDGLQEVINDDTKSFLRLQHIVHDCQSMLSRYELIGDDLQHLDWSLPHSLPEAYAAQPTSPIFLILPVPVMYTVTQCIEGCACAEPNHRRKERTWTLAGKEVTVSFGWSMSDPFVGHAVIRQGCGAE